MKEKTDLNETKQRYDGVAIFLHWTIALAIVLLVFGEVIRHEWPKGTFMRDGLKALHNPVGTVVFAAIIFRVVWWTFVARTIEDAHAVTGPLESMVARLVKLLLYVMMLAIPITGIVYVFARGRVIDFAVFEIASPVMVALTKTQVDGVKEWHEWLGWAILVLAAVHALAALWHHYGRRDDVLGRMLPGTKVGH